MNKICAELESFVNCALNNEYEAAYFYEGLVIHFKRLGLNGFARFFSKQVEEERRHIHSLIEYLINTREFFPSLLTVVAPPVFPSSTLDCFKAALNKEIAITSSIKALIDKAEVFEDNHLEFFLKSFFLSEQYKSITELNNHIQILSNLQGSFINIWLYDNDLKFD